jgi:hypothetical protein
LCLSKGIKQIGQIGELGHLRQLRQVQQHCRKIENTNGQAMIHRLTNDQLSVPLTYERVFIDEIVTEFKVCLYYPEAH